jgi:probable phosphoglycerate mutase
MQTEILLIRHGQSQANVDIIFAGHLDSPLSELGERQALLLKEYLLTQKIDRLYSSDLIRAKNTIKPYADQVGLPIITSEKLREFYGGDFEGVKYEDLPKLYPIEYGKFWLHDTENTQMPNGESVKGGMQRGFEAITEIAKENLGKSVVIATHGGIIRGFECLANGVKWAQGEWVENASVTKMIYKDGKFITVQRNLNAYLGELTSSLPKGV